MYMYTHTHTHTHAHTHTHTHRNICLYSNNTLTSYDYSQNVGHRCRFWHERL